MRRLSSLILLLTATCTCLLAQAPYAFHYQGVARDGGAVITGPISLQLTIHQGLPNGPVVYQERQASSTNAQGVFGVIVGQGVPVQCCIDFDWTTESLYLQTEIDPTGGLNFTDMGTIPLVSVPYALVARDVLNDQVEDSDADPANEFQSLSFNIATNELSISNGNTVTIPSGGTDADADPTNEIQELSKTGNTISLSKGGGSVTDEVDDADADPGNELQTLTKAGSTITLSQGGSVTDEVDDADADPNNELQTLGKVGNLITLSQGGSVTDEVDDADADPNNEIQTLVWDDNAKTLSLSQGNTVDLSALGGGGPEYWQLDSLYGLYHQGHDVYIGTPDTSPALHLAPTFLDFHTGQPQYSVLTPDNLAFGGVGYTSQMTKNSVTVEGAEIDTYVQAIHDTLGFTARVTGFFNARTRQTPWNFTAQPFAFDGATSYTEHNFNNFFIRRDSRSTTLDIDKLLFWEDGLGPYAELSGDGAGLLNLYNGANWSVIQASGKNPGGIININGPTGGRNVYLGYPSGYPNYGYIFVENDLNINKAGMYIDAAGMGIVYGDVKSFVMANPEKPGREIWYASLEGPEAAAYERGVATLNQGEAWIPFTDSYRIVANPATMTVILTPHSTDTYGLAVVEKGETGFRVKELKGGTGSFSFDWEVKCVRKGLENWRVDRDSRERAPEGN